MNVNKGVLFQSEEIYLGHSISVKGFLLLQDKPRQHKNG